MEEKKIGRGLSDGMIEKLQKSEIFALYKNHKQELFLGIRNNYINLYYNGASICKIEYLTGKITLKFSTHSKYLEGKVDPSEINSNMYVVKHEADHIINHFDNIIAIINENYSEKKGKAEKVAQQKLVLQNNQNKSSKWFCIDMEYIRQRVNNKAESYGRFDIIALTKERPHSIALIELKVGNNAIGGDSGIAKHLEDYTKYIDEKMTNKELIPQLISIINSYKKLGIKIPFEQDLKETDFKIEPQPYFILLEKDNQTEGKIRRYIFKNEPKASTKCFEKNTKKEYDNLNFTPIFLLTEKRAYEIKDIIEDSNYENTVIKG